MNVDEIRGEASSMLRELTCASLQVVLIPAPYPQFSGHMIRSVTNENPKWYKKIFAERGYIHRDRIKNTLQKIINGHASENDAYYCELIDAIKESIEEYKYYAQENPENKATDNAGNFTDAVQEFFMGDWIKPEFNLDFSGMPA